MQTRRNFVSLVAASALASACKTEGSGAPSGSGGGAKPLKIAVIPKGTTHEFWKTVHAGAVKAAKELGVESKVVLTKLNELGEFVRSASSTVEAPVVRKLREAMPAAPAGQRR